ncbi:MULTISPECIES: RNA methyltransferase [Rhodomicrobium]|uniref:TrmH family RNA methyltransferase n=1 Tax=Rhodomicrobium TaxID=1068 RepID=UPI000B4BA1A3|nr:MULTISPECIES: RNA methyltransferase [Rhodomicrobium]
MKDRRAASHFKPGRGAPRGGRGRADDGVIRIYGLHAAEAALANPRRAIRKVYATPNAAQRIAAIRPDLRNIESVTPKDLDRKLGEDTVHQGILVEAEPLPDLTLDDLPDARLLIFLDQITDPHNVGAILRSAAVFGADGLLMTARHSPPLQGALAKAASGGLDLVPIVQVPNLARALADAGERGFTRLGLDSGGEVALEDFPVPDRLVLVLGAEDRGLRRLSGEHCDAICALTTFGPIASLNVSNAAAIALHMMAFKMRRAAV